MLDTAFAPAKDFPHLNKKANLKNAYFDLKLPRQCEDEEIYQKAIEENRFVVTTNFVRVNSVKDCIGKAIKIPAILNIMNHTFLTHFLRGVVLVAVINLLFFTVTQLFFIFSKTIDLGLGVILLLPLVYITTAISIYFLCLKFVGSTYKNPKRLAVFLTLVSLPLLVTIPLGRIALNDIDAVFMQQVNFLPLTLAVLLGQTILLWSFRNLGK